MTHKIPCGTNMGYGASCCKGHLCPGCTEIERLTFEFEVKTEVANELDIECNNWAAEYERLSTERSAVLGWREYDHPEWFCRRTAEYMADLMREASASGRTSP